MAMKYLGDPMYKIMLATDYLHVVCSKCEEACRFEFKGLDPTIPLVEITCPKCGSSGKRKLFNADLTSHLRQA